MRKIEGEGREGGVLGGETDKASPEYDDFHQRAPLTNVIFYCPMYWSLIQYNLERKELNVVQDRVVMYAYEPWNYSNPRTTVRALADDEESLERRGLSVSEIPIVVP